MGVSSQLSLCHSTDVIDKQAQRHLETIWCKPLTPRGTQKTMVGKESAAEHTAQVRELSSPHVPSLSVHRWRKRVSEMVPTMHMLGLLWGPLLHNLPSSYSVWQNLVLCIPMSC